MIILILGTNSYRNCANFLSLWQMWAFHNSHRPDTGQISWKKISSLSTIMCRTFRHCKRQKLGYSWCLVNFVDLWSLLKQGDQLMSDSKKYFVWEVYFCQKKYIFDPERSTNRSKSDKIIFELPHFWPLIVVKYFINLTYNIRDYKVAGIIWHWFLTNSS